jgi:hypothetical protein
MGGFLSGKNPKKYKDDIAGLTFLGIVTGAFVVKAIVKKVNKKKNK